MSAKTRVEFTYDGDCRSFDGQGKLLCEFKTVYSIYNRQYGTPLSPDGTRVFVGTWERALYCYDLFTGQLCWKQGPGRVREIIVMHRFLIVEMHGRGIYKRSLATGSLVHTVGMQGIECMYRLNENLIFTGPWRGHYAVMKIPTLRTVTSIKPATINPNRCLSLSICAAAIRSGRLIVSGREQYSNMTFNDSVEGTSFQRCYSMKNGSRVPS